MDDDKKDNTANFDSSDAKERDEPAPSPEKQPSPKNDLPDTLDVNTLSLSDDNDTTSPPPPIPSVGQVKKESKFKHFVRSKKGKVILVFLVILMIAGVLYAVPQTRYGILGKFIKKSAAISVIDSQTKKPVTQATVELAGLSAKTDAAGKVTLGDVPVGEYTLKVSKKNYKDTSAAYIVPVFTQSDQPTLDLVATGRQVTIKVINVISKKPVEGATVTVDETTALTDQKGEGALVLPADKPDVQAKVTREGFNEATVAIKVTDQSEATELPLTPSGSIYFLSKATGKINVMKANLDGTSPSIVLQGTGSEGDYDTSLLAARDWQYLALHAKRKGNVAGQLYAIETKTNTVKVIDEGDISIQSIGWSGHNFIYLITRNDVAIWQGKRQALKSYNAETAKVSTIDETAASGFSPLSAEYELIQNAYLVEGKVVYVKNVSRSSGAAAHALKPAIMVATTGNGQTQRVKEFEFATSSSMDAKLYEPQEVYFRVQIDTGPVGYFEYEGTSLKSVTNDDNKFYNTVYPTFLMSPSSQKTFWDESRNGKNALFVGDKNGSNSTEIAQQSEYGAYGWYGDEYILLSKNKSELFIAAAGQTLENPLKITNYHKPLISYEGYGYGYGGR